MQYFDDIPKTEPDTPLLNLINNDFSELKKFNQDNLLKVCDELRKFLLYTIGKTGGHFSSNLGVIELTVALHYVFNTPEDKIVWDVGHQSYAHKVLTGRKDRMFTLREQEGIAPFPKITESVFDAFGTGHASTSISAALGMAVSAKINQTNNKHIAIIGDGALTGGLALEALNHAIDTNVNMLVILNDNDISISKNVGGVSKHFTKLITSNTYNKFRLKNKDLFKKNTSMFNFLQKTENYIKSLFAPSFIFDALGWNYIGPVDGHNVLEIIGILEHIKKLEGLQFLHVVTRKGKGFLAAENKPVKYHAIEKININNNKQPKYSDVFGSWLSDKAKQHANFVAITPAMALGSNLVDFSENFPERFFDTGITEEHALTFAAGIATTNLKPIVAIYSTFLQRAYDQLIHDCAIQKLNIMLAIDRCGIVGEDGSTHNGVFDITFMLPIPNILIACPSNEQEMLLLLNTCFYYQGLSAIRYPKEQIKSLPSFNDQVCDIGKAKCINKGKKCAVLAFGPLINQVVDFCMQENFTLYDMRFIKPLCLTSIKEASLNHKFIVTIEDGQLIGGVGQLVNSYVKNFNNNVKTLNLGLPDKFIEHNRRELIYQQLNLDENGIKNSILDFLRER